MPGLNIKQHGSLTFDEYWNKVTESIAQQVEAECDKSLNTWCRAKTSERGAAYKKLRKAVVEHSQIPAVGDHYGVEKVPEKARITKGK